MIYRRILSRLFLAAILCCTLWSANRALAAQTPAVFEEREGRDDFAQLLFAASVFHDAFVGSGLATLFAVHFDCNQVFGETGPQFWQSVFATEPRETEPLVTERQVNIEYFLDETCTTLTAVLSYMHRTTVTPFLENVVKVQREIVDHRVCRMTSDGRCIPITLSTEQFAEQLDLEMSPVFASLDSAGEYCAAESVTQLEKSCQ